MELTRDVLLGPLAECATAEEVAELLRSHGITGHRREPASCPVSEFLIRRLVQVGIGDRRLVQVSVGDRYRYVDVGRNAVLVWYKNSALWTEFTVTPKFTVTPAIAEFVERFDDGEFPDLQEKV